jgi:hypothetical protein
MRAKLPRGLSVIVLSLVATLAPGCSHDTLQSGSQQLDMNYTPNPTGAGRFARASFIIDKILALPADPNEAALYGANRIILRVSPVSTFEADLTATAPVMYSDITLSAGTYVVKQVDYRLLVLVDTNVAANPQHCIDGVAVIDGQQPPGIPQLYTFLNPPSLTFTVQPGQTQLALTVNVPGLIKGYEDAYTCQYVPCTGCPVDPRPTLTAFDETTFRNALLANISIK